MKHSYVLGVALFISATHAFAAKKTPNDLPPPAFVFGVGAHIPNFGMGLTTSSSGERQRFTEKYYGIALGGKVAILKDPLTSALISVLPRWWVSLNTTTDLDHSVSKRLHKIDLLFTNSFQKPVLNAFEILIGPTLSLRQVNGSGGTTTLNNGNSTTTFALADGSSTASFWGTTFGIALLLPANIHIETDLTIHSPFNKVRRNYQIGAIIQYAYF